MDTKSLDQKIQVLTHQNQRLAVQLEEKRHHTKVLEEKVAHYEKCEQDYSQTLLCINRIWEQLSSDLQHMCTSTGTGAAPADAQATDGDDATASTSGVQSRNIVDPFLTKLLRSTGDISTLKSIQDAVKQINADSSEVELALLRRASATKSTLSRLLSKLRQLQMQRDNALSQLSSSNPESALAEEHRRALDEVSELRAQLDVAHASQRTAMEQLQLTDDRLTEAEEQIKRLQNELADKEQELSNVQRKYLTLKNEGTSGDAQQLSLAPQASKDLPKAQVAAGASTAAEDADGLQVLQALYDKRMQDLEKEREAHLKTQRELQEAVARLGDESWVPNTRSYQGVLLEVQRLNELLGGRAKEMEALARERDEAQREAHIKNHYFHADGVSRQKLVAIEKLCAELRVAKGEAERTRQEVELALQREKEKAGHAKSVAELRVMISTLQAQVASLQQHVQLNKVSVDQMEASAQEVSEARRGVECRELEIQRLNDRLRRKDQDLEEQKRREAGLKDRINDLKAFVDVLTVYCNDPRDITTVRSSEAALKEQVAVLRAQLEGHELQARVRDLEAAERASKDQVDLMAMEADTLRLEISVLRGRQAELEQQLQQARSESELFMREIEATGQAYEDMQSQNVRLLQQLTERDESNNLMISERIKMSQLHASLSEQLDASRSELERGVKDAADLAAQKDTLEKEIVRLAAELNMAKEQCRISSTRLEGMSLELRKREEAAAAQQAVVEGLQRQVAEAKSAAGEAGEKLAKEKTKRQKQEDEVKMLQQKVERLRRSAGTSSASREYEEEVNAMRQLLNCNVCHERQKNVIITKCCHVFCDKCIKRNLEARNRKCPGCGMMFGQADVKQFFFT
mmetsp:Transcript_2932/g.6418  ORF Transcript_2932/g.6418 Transcript_2932/m.6418 type:complete len:863 (+) Transcript_2932:174-2762(+)